MHGTHAATCDRVVLVLAEWADAQMFLAFEHLSILQCSLFSVEISLKVLCYVYFEALHSC